MIRLIALLSWYDESPSDLVTCLMSLAQLGVDHVVALDGRYEMFEGDGAASHANQHAAITLACRELGLDLTMSVPSEPWAGNEVEKRNALFALGCAVAREGDWFMVNDADMIALRWPADLKARLAATECEAAEVEIFDAEAARLGQGNRPDRFSFRGLYRAQPILVGPHHHASYSTVDGRSLWNGDGKGNHPVLAEDLTGDVVIEHRPDGRSDERTMTKMRYYAKRDAAGVERGPCGWCDEMSKGLVPVHWRWSSDLNAPVAEWREACRKHATEADKVGRAELVLLGVDPDSVGVENRMGKVPVGIAR